MPWTWIFQIKTLITWQASYNLWCLKLKLEILNSSIITTTVNHSCKTNLGVKTQRLSRTCDFKPVLCYLKHPLRQLLAGENISLCWILYSEVSTCEKFYFEISGSARTQLTLTKLTIFFFHTYALVLKCFLIGSYIFIEASQRSPGEKARLLSGWIEPNETVCLQLWYHMHGADIGNLIVYLKTNQSQTLVWRLSGDKGNLWTFGQKTLNSPSFYKVSL